MRPVGYSTGALTPGDVPGALAMLRGAGPAAVELSALRLHELTPLLEALPSLDLSPYAYVSVHAPSRFDAVDEPRIIEALEALPASWPIVLHPDTLHDLSAWRRLGRRVAIENMDKHKARGRTLAELGRVFDALPEATFCFDIGHAHQVDRTMTDAYLLLRSLGARLGQVHVSEVSTAGQHEPLSRSALGAFQKVAAWVPEEVPIILEAPAGPSGIVRQMALAAEAFATARA